MASTMWDRMGGAFSCLSMHADAVECYEKLVAHYASAGSLLLQGRALMLLASKMENIETNSVHTYTPPSDTLHRFDEESGNLTCQ
jgi:hypothetical protein